MAYDTGWSNVAIGYEAGWVYSGSGGSADVDTSQASDDAPAADAPAPVWHCDYCGQSNAAEREGCRGCQAARPVHAAMVHESVTTWKGVLLSRLTEEERDEMAAWLTGPDAWRYPLPVLDADMESRVRAALRQQLRPEPEDDTMVTRTLTGESIIHRRPRPRPAILPIDSGWYSYPRPCIEQGDNKATQRKIIQRLKQCVGLR